MTAIAPGSHLAISHARQDGRTQLNDAARVYDGSGSPNPMRLRTHAEVAALFAPVTMVDPGLVLLPLWRPEPPEEGEQAPEVDDDYPGFAGLGMRE
jgi:hypothetical protein